MALALLLVFRSRWRLLPLAIALAAAALTFGLFGLVGGSLTMASIAVLPILIGLAVDYAIQLQARYDEAIAIGASPVLTPPAWPHPGAGPTIATACLATAAGFLALQLSPTPMVRGFGLLLVVGIAIAFALAFTAGFAALSLRREAGVRVPLRALGFSPGGLRLSPGGRGEKQDAARLRGTRHFRLCCSAFLALAQAHPTRVLGVGLAWLRRLGARDPDRNVVRHPRAGAAERRGRAGTEQAAGRDRGLRGAGRERSSPRPDRPGDVRVDGGLQAAGCWQQRVLGRQSELPRG